MSRTEAPRRPNGKPSCATQPARAAPHRETAKTSAHCAAPQGWGNRREEVESGQRQTQVGRQMCGGNKNREVE